MKYLAATILALAFSAQAADGGGLKKYDSAQIRSEIYRKSDKSDAPPLPPEVVFELDGPPKVVDGNRVVLRGHLDNPLKRPVELLTTGGNGLDPLLLLPTGGKFQWSSLIPRQPPVPAPPTRRTIPARSSVSFQTEFYLNELEYEGTPPVKFEWNFGFYSQRQPARGVVEVVLPEQPTAAR